jgi:hypothetical protein
LQYFITIFAFGVAWVTVEGASRGWAWWLVAVLLLELVATTLICALYRVFFQPLLSILAIAGSFVGPVVIICSRVAVARASPLKCFPSMSRRTNSKKSSPRIFRRITRHHS